MGNYLTKNQKRFVLTRFFPKAKEAGLKNQK